MKITDDKTLAAIQQEFATKFPGLKIEFYKEAHQVGEGSAATATLDASKTVGTVRTIHQEGELSIDGHLKVSTLESNFKTQYGLNVQVFRKSGDLWMQTSATDEWTLAKQNRKGEHAVAAFKAKYGDGVKTV